MREEGLAADLPSALDLKQHEEIRVARATPVARLKTCHCRRSLGRDRCDPRLESGRRSILVDHRAEIIEGPIHRIAGIAAANIGAVDEYRSHEFAIAGARSIGVAVKRGGYRLIRLKARGLF